MRKGNKYLFWEVFGIIQTAAKYINFVAGTLIVLVIDIIFLERRVIISQHVYFQLLIFQQPVHLRDNNSD